MNKAGFEWPTPNYFNFTQDDDLSESETCLVYRRDGTKVLGELIQFLPKESSIVFLHTHNETNQTIHLDEIKSIRLVKALYLKKHKSPHLNRVPR